MDMFGNTKKRAYSG